MKNYKLSLGVIYMTTSSLAKMPTESDTALIKSSNKKIFNFNPQETEVSSFVSSILLEMLGADKLAALRGKQERVDSLLKKIDNADDKEKIQLKAEIHKLKGELYLAAAEKVIEKIRFTFTGFDIDKKPIPSALVAGADNILENKILSLLAKCYLSAQIYSVFNITDNEFDNLSRKALEGRDASENLKYNKILTVLGGVFELEKSLMNLDKENKQSTASLEEIKKMGKEGQKIHDLLKPIVHLLSEDATSTEKNHLLGTIRNFITLFREALEEILSPVHNLMTGTRSVSFVESSSPPPREIYRSIPEPSFVSNSANFFKKAPERGALLDEKTENNLQSANQTAEKASERYFSIRL
ncbi:hypothetical protein [Rickettsiella endosymbiont of Dermanyssus gallinae]|uniref:hypothetical protein n=1 Tax=Rickettsiella endosymbiont of Dermanyssus gallinae TaxID=2856608 RepID=UPI001C532EA8|nr:hypothetical protein [Rickettsiella endosymbiont of Dermanyssus gallinae]